MGGKEGIKLTFFSFRLLFEQENCLFMQICRESTKNYLRKGTLCYIVPERWESCGCEFKFLFFFK